MAPYAAAGLIAAGIVGSEVGGLIGAATAVLILAAFVNVATGEIGACG